MLLADVGVMVSSTGDQSGCIDFGDQAICSIGGFASVGSNSVNWIGNHRFLTLAGDCSEASGTWTLNSGNHGLFTGTFTSDVSCGV